METNFKTGRSIPDVIERADGPPVVIMVDEQLSEDEVLRRLGKLESVREDLEAAALAIRALQLDAGEKVQQHEKLKRLLEGLVDEKSAAEAALQAPEEAFTRLLARYEHKSRWKHRIQGFGIGVAASVVAALVWHVIQQILHL